jgi:hypothetical protein
MAAKLARERIAPAIGEFGKGDDDESEPAQIRQNALNILPRLDVKPKRSIGIEGGGPEFSPLRRVEDYHA